MITLQWIAINVVLVLSMKIVMSEDMLLEKLGRFFERKIDEGYKIFDLWYCQWCSGTFYSFPALAFSIGLGVIPFEWNWQLLIKWPLVVGGTSIIAGNLWNLYLTVNQIKEKNEAETEYFKMLMSQPEEENNNN